MAASGVRDANRGRGFEGVGVRNYPPPLTNIQFTNRYAASFIRGAILNRAADAESLASMGEMGVEEATNRVGALLARVGFLDCVTFFLSIVLLLFFLTPFLGSFLPMFSTSPALDLAK